MQPARLGRYEILRPLARGGMAELFLARATGIQGFEKRVVVKRILPEMVGDAEYVAMFLEEARLAAGLHHSNIVQVYDIGEDEAAPFFAMEYLDGQDVRALARAAERQRERIPIEHALAIAIGVAAGLHHAHEQRDGDGKPLGIVHRDVTPHNVAVTYDGGVKLIDFGVAKTRRSASATRHGTLKGKLGYMSPEQCRGEELDRRSDVFAVAIVLWELVAGRRLYGGRSDFGIMKSIVETDAPRVSTVWHDCPTELEAIIMRGLRREREARPQTAEELQLALEAFARERRLPVSNAGLGHYVRALFGGGARDQPSQERTTTLYEVAGAEDDDGAAATVVDGVIASAASEPSHPLARRTRALARPRPRGWVGPVVVAAVALAAVVGWRVAAYVRRPATPAVEAQAKAQSKSQSKAQSKPQAKAQSKPQAQAQAQAALSAPDPSPPLATTPAPKLAAAPATTLTTTLAPIDPSKREVAAPAATTRTTVRERPSRMRAPKHAHAAHPPARVDLDAPLPPR